MKAKNLNRISLFQITKKRSLCFLLLFSYFSFLFLAGAEKPKPSVLPESSKAKVKNATTYKPKPFVLPERAKEQKARGVVVRYRYWPSLKKQKKLAVFLKSSGLKQTKSIKAFKAQLFEWEKGGLKLSKEAEKACLKLKNLSYVRRCSPDHLLPVNFLFRSSVKATGFEFSFERGKFSFLQEKQDIRNIKQGGDKKRVSKKKSSLYFSTSEAEFKTSEVRETSSASEVRETSSASEVSEVYWSYLDFPVFLRDSCFCGSFVFREKAKQVKQENLNKIGISEASENVFPVKAGISFFAVIPAKAGIQLKPEILKPDQYKTSERVFLTSLDSVLWKEMLGASRFFQLLFLAKAVQATKSKTEAGFNFECQDCKQEGSLAKEIQKTLNIRTCDLISDKQKLMKGKLSDYWAQELIGSDLLREELEKTSPPNIENWIAVFDTKDEDDHNIAVKNLISDEVLHAVLPELEKRKPSSLKTNLKSNEGKGYKPTLSFYETPYPGDYLSLDFKKGIPHYINNSIDWWESQNIYEVFQKFSSNETSKPIIVVSSGNEFPIRLDNVKNQASKDFNVVLVGSFSPSGFVSEFSNSGEEVHILAPSDHWLTSAGKNGEYKKFGGTSGAAPLVTGSLAGFEWLSGYHPTAKEAKLLLEKTALPTLHSHEKPRINGAGLLNAYKLGEVAKRLNKKCKSKSADCFKKEILKDENYRFAEDKGLKRDLERIFPSCSARREESENISSLPSCEEKGKVFTKLRKAVLLNPTKKLLKSLSCIYTEAELTQNALALDKLAMALGTEKEVRAELKSLLSRKEAVSDDYLRLMVGMGGFEEEFNPSELKRGFKMVRGIGEKGLDLLNKTLDSGDIELQETALYSAGNIGEKALPLLEKAFDSGIMELQKAALVSAGNIGEKGLPLLEKAFDSGDIELQETALVSAGNIGENALPLLEKAFDSGDIELQEMALYSAGNMGEESVPMLKRILKTNQLPESLRKRIENYLRIFE